MGAEGGGFGGEAPLPSPGPEPATPPEGGGAEVTPESKIDKLNILVENNLIGGSQILDFETGQESLLEMDIELDKLLNS
jgi:hypothetical protein